MDSDSNKVKGHAFVANSLYDNSRAHFGDVINYNYSYHSSDHAHSIGVLGSIGGLRAQITALHARLQFHVSTYSDPPWVAERMLSEVRRGMELISEIKTRFNQYDAGLSSYIQADNLIASLTNGILILSSLHTALETALAEKKSCLYDSQSMLHEQLLLRIRLDLEEQNKMWRAKLNILDCRSESEALAAGTRFDSLVTGLLHSKPDLVMRLESVEEQLEAVLRRLEDCEGSPESTNVVNAQLDKTLQNHQRGTIDALQLASARDSFVTEYHLVLARSGVYRRHEHRSEIFSIPSSNRRSYVWSELTRFTGTNLSILSVIALPIRVSELADGQWYRVDTQSTSETKHKADLDPSTVSRFLRRFRTRQKIRIGAPGDPVWNEHWSHSDGVVRNKKGALIAEGDKLQPLVLRNR